MKICTLMGSFWPKYLFELKSTEELCFMTRNSDAKFDGKLICSFRNDMRNLANFLRLKNSDFILQSKKAELNQIKNSKQLDWLDSVRKLYFSLEINEYHNSNFLHMFCRIVVFNLLENFQESCENRWFSSMFSRCISRA